MNRKVLLLVVPLLMLASAGCSTAGAPSAIPPLPTASVMTIPSPTATDLPTPTPTPSPTPTLTPTPLPEYLTAENFSRWVQVQSYVQPLEKALKIDIFSARSYSMAYSPDGRYLAVGGCTSSHSGGCISSYIDSDSFLVVQDAETAEVVAKIPETDTTISGLAFTSDGEKLVYGIFPGKVVIWNLSEGKRERVPWKEPDKNCYPKISLSPNDTTLAVVCNSQLMLLEFPSGDLIAAKPAEDHSRYFPQFSADGSRLAVFSAEYGQQITIYDTATWQEVSSIKPAVQIVQAAALSPDGKLLATASSSDKAPVVLWDVNSGQQIAALTDDFSFINALAFTPDGSLLLVSGLPGGDLYDGVSLWDPTAQQLIGKMHPTMWPNRVIFSADGRSIVSDDDFSGLFLQRWSLPDADALAFQGVMLDFLSALQQGDYQRAAGHFLPSEEELAAYGQYGWPTDDLPALLEAVCRQAALGCPAVKDILWQEKDYQGSTWFLLRFNGPDGELYLDSRGESIFYLGASLNPDGEPVVFTIPGFLFPE